jgi:hypothetical protein
VVYFKIQSYNLPRGTRKNRENCESVNRDLNLEISRYEAGLSTNLSLVQTFSLGGVIYLFIVYLPTRFSVT